MTQDTKPKDVKPNRSRRPFKAFRPKRYQPEPIAGMVENVLMKSATPQRRLVIPLIMHWDEVAGPNLAPLTMPLGMKSSRRSGKDVWVLEVAINGAMATIADMEKPQLLRQINVYLGSDLDDPKVIDIKWMHQAVEKPINAAPAQITEAENQSVQLAIQQAPPSLDEALKQLGQTIEDVKLEDDKIS